MYKCFIRIKLTWNWKVFLFLVATYMGCMIFFQRTPEKLYPPLSSTFASIKPRRNDFNYWASRSQVYVMKKFALGSGEIRNPVFPRLRGYSASTLNKKLLHTGQTSVSIIRYWQIPGSSYDTRPGLEINTNRCCQISFHSKAGISNQFLSFKYLFPCFSLAWLGIWILIVRRLKQGTLHYRIQEQSMFTFKSTRVETFQNML